MSHSRKKKPQVNDRWEWRLMLSIAIVSIFATYAWVKLIDNAAQQKFHQAQLLEVPELIETVDAPPQAEVSDIPDETAQPAPLPVPASSILREVEIEGPVDCIVGDAVHLRVRTDGPAINYAWTISPKVDGLFVLDDGSAAIFTNRNAQQYTIYVSAVDSQGNIEQDTFTFSLVQHNDALVSSNLAEAHPEPTIPERVDYWITLVQSPSKESEVSIVSQSFRQTANLLRTNAIGSGQNVLAKMEKGLEVSLGPQTYAAWEAFLSPLEAYLADMSAKGYLGTRDSWINTLDNLAAVMESRSQRKHSLQ